MRVYARSNEQHLSIFFSKLGEIALTACIIHLSPGSLTKPDIVSSSDDSLQLGAIAKIFLEFSPEAPHAPEAPEAHSNRNCKCLTELDITSRYPSIDRPNCVPHGVFPYLEVSLLVRSVFD